MSALLTLLLQTGVATIGPAAAKAPPFAVGERFEYSAKMGILSLGDATIEVGAMDTVRGERAWKFRFQLDGGNALFRITSRLESWTSTGDFSTRRYRQYSKENGKEYVREYEVYPDAGFFRQKGVEGTTPTAEDPLDDASFLYFIRTTELVVGKTYTYNRYFRPDKGPIVIRVLKRETMELPDKRKVTCLVLNPVIGEKGTFAKRNDARLWITDDARRIPVQIKSRYPFGAITLRLEKMTAGATGARDGDR
ncbi:MAG: DUF3108 domain-containing protein [Gemmatimonadales bacterium]